MSEKYHVGAGVGVIVTDGERVLLQERTGAHGANTWAPPGGKVDKGEKPIDTAYRELGEETGVKAEKLECIGFTNDHFESEGLHYITLWFIGTITVDSPEPSVLEPHKCLQIEWVEIEEFLTDSDRAWFLTVQHLQEDGVMVQKVREYVSQV